MMMLAALVAAAWPTAAQYQPAKMVQQLDELSAFKSLIVIAWSRSHVSVIQDTVDYVEFNLYNAADTASLPDGIVHVAPLEYGGGILYVQGFPTVLGVTLHLKTKSLSLSAEGYSWVSLSPIKARDSLVYDDLSLQAEEHGTLRVDSHIHAENISLHASSLGLVVCNGYRSPNFFEEKYRGGEISVYFRNGEYDKNEFASRNVWGNTRLAVHRYKPIERVHLSLLGGIHNWGTSSLNGLSGTEYVFDYRTVAYWERTAWEDAASVRTTVGNVQAELTYDVVARRNFAIGVGLGYERNEYRLRHPFVSYVEGTDIAVHTDKINTTLSNYTGFSILPEIGEITYRWQTINGTWTSRFVTNYATLPIYFTYYADQNHRKGFHAGVAVVPGMALSKGQLVRHFDANGGRVPDSYSPAGDTTWGTLRYDIHDVQEVKVNAKVDVRLTVGWANWSVFLQLSTTPVIAGDRTLGLYPMKLGARISL